MSVEEQPRVAPRFWRTLCVAGSVTCVCVLPFAYVYGFVSRLPWAAGEPVSLLAALVVGTALAACTALVVARLSHFADPGHGADLWQIWTSLAAGMVALGIAMVALIFTMPDSDGGWTGRAFPQVTQAVYHVLFELWFPTSVSVGLMYGFPYLLTPRRLLSRVTRWSETFWIAGIAAASIVVVHVCGWRPFNAPDWLQTSWLYGPWCAWAMALAAASRPRRSLAT